MEPVVDDGRGDGFIVVDFTAVFLITLLFWLIYFFIRSCLVSILSRGLGSIPSTGSGSILSRGWGSILSRGWGSILSRMFIEGSKYLWSFKSCSYISTPSTSPFIRKAVNFGKFDIMPRKRRTQCTPFFAHSIDLVLSAHYRFTPLVQLATKTFSSPRLHV